MKNLLKYFVVLALCLFCLTCKKKTTIKVEVFNFALNEPIANATVALVERKLNNFGASYSCNEIETRTTDANGECSFDREKLKTNSKYQYYFAITSAYGIQQSYPCAGKTSGFIKVGESQEQVLNYSNIDGSIFFETNNLLNPAQIGDSLSLYMNSDIYYVANDPNNKGGGGVQNSYSFYGDYSYPYPTKMTSNIIKTPCGYKTLRIRKRKLGNAETIFVKYKVLPNETTRVVVDW
jgi:hypothetical protein